MNIKEQEVKRFQHLAGLLNESQQPQQIDEKFNIVKFLATALLAGSMGTAKGQFAPGMQDIARSERAVQKAMAQDQDYKLGADIIQAVKTYPEEASNWAESNNASKIYEAAVKLIKKIESNQEQIDDTDFIDLGKMFRSQRGRVDQFLSAMDDYKKTNQMKESARMQYLSGMMTERESIIMEDMLDRLFANLRGTGSQASAYAGNFVNYLKGDKEAIKDPLYAKNMTMLQQKTRNLEKALKDVMNDISKLFPQDTLKKASPEFKKLLVSYIDLLRKTEKTNNQIATGNVSKSVGKKASEPAQEDPTTTSEPEVTPEPTSTEPETQTTAEPEAPLPVGAGEEEPAPAEKAKRKRVNYKATWKDKEGKMQSLNVFSIDNGKHVNLKTKTGEKSFEVKSDSKGQYIKLNQFKLRIAPTAKPKTTLKEELSGDQKKQFDQVLYLLQSRKDITDIFPDKLSSYEELKNKVAEVSIRQDPDSLDNIIKGTMNELPVKVANSIFKYLKEKTKKSMEEQSESKKKLTDV